MDRMTVKEAGAPWGITTRRVQFLCEQERVSGAQKKPLGRIAAPLMNQMEVWHDE